MKTVSVIVPVYNTEKYLRECMGSILAQSYAGLEVILVDDGSTDGSGAICDEYIQADSRVRVIHKANGGLSSARNAGMELATGEYIAFVDSDDTLRKEYIEKLVKAVENTDSGEIAFAFCDCETGRCTLDVSGLKGKTTVSRSEFISNLEDPVSRDYLLEVMGCNKLYRNNSEPARFPEGKLHEDEFYLNRVLEKADKCAFVPEKLYIYRENDEGITGSKNRFNLRHLDVFDAYEERAALFLELGENAAAEAVARNGLYKICRMYLDAKDEKKETRDKIAEKYKAFYKNNAKYMNAKKRAKYALFLVNPAFSKIICK